MSALANGNIILNLNVKIKIKQFHWIFGEDLNTKKIQKGINLESLDTILENSITVLNGKALDVPSSLVPDDL